MGPGPSTCRTDYGVSMGGLHRTIWVLENLGASKSLDVMGFINTFERNIGLSVTFYFTRSWIGGH